MALEVAEVEVHGAIGDDGNSFKRDRSEEAAQQFEQAGLLALAVPHAACDLGALSGWSRLRRSSHLA